MPPRTELPARATLLLKEQAGVITTAQLCATGLSHRVIGRLVSPLLQVATGVYVQPPVTWHAAVWAGLLRAGAEGVVGGAGAIFLHGGLRDAPDEILVWGTRTHPTIDVGRWRVTFRKGHREGFGSPRRTRVDDALLDHARSATELDTIATVTSALARRVTTGQRLTHALDARSRVRHSATIRALADPSSQGCESPLEWLFLRDVIRAHRLPEPARQVDTGTGRVDALYEAYGVAVELDGMRDHAEWSKDMLRDNAHALDLGLITLRYGFDAVLKQPGDVAAQLARALRQRGWKGQRHA